MVALREERANLGNSTEVGEDALALLAVPLADLVVVMTDPGRSPSLVGSTALTQLNLKQGELWKGEGQNVSLPKSHNSLGVRRGEPDGGPVVSLCSITGSFVWLWELIPSGSLLNLAGRFIHIWASYGYVVKQVM